ncbi:MAG: phage/plasmid primase, P4 family [Actinomycetota bacterium]|nr:phage/plasmid primase, P4 family [Actinomycetota bacterium]
MPFAYAADARTPRRWLAFLDQLWGDDNQPKQTLAEIIGYLISGDTSQQKAFLFVGPKRSGKGTIARVIGGLVGVHNVVGVTSNQLAGNFGLAQLVGKPVAIMSDARIRSDQSLLTERLLAVSGEDVLTADRKYRDPWTGKFPTRFVVLSNELPRLVDTSGALASRFVVLMFTRSFYGAEDTELTGKLHAELPGILNWALAGLDRLRASGRFIMPDASADAVRELVDLGSPVGAFVRDRCQIGPGKTVACDQLYQAWRTWCDDFGRVHPGTAQTFGRDLRAAVPGLKVTQPREDGGRQRRHYEGITLATAAHNGQ